MKEMKKQSASLYIIPLIILAGVILLIAFIYLISLSLENNEPEETEIVRECRDIQIPYNYAEEYQETVPYADVVCESREISYYIDNFVLNYNICNEYQDICKKYTLGICTDKTTFCVDRTISCSLNLKNLDSEKSGTWTIRFNFYEIGTETAIKTDDISLFIYPQTTWEFTGIGRIQSEGQNGDANKDIFCYYHRINLPTKQVCRDVTRYREVTRTRTTTRYRTETKCD